MLRQNPNYGDTTPPCPCEGAEAPADEGSRQPRGPRVLYPQAPARGRPVLVPILEKRTFDTTNFLGGAAPDLDIILCPAICVLEYAVIRLAVRVHASSMTTGQRFRFIVSNTLPSDEDPTQDFVEATSFFTVDVTSSTAVPGLVTGRGSGPEAYLRIVLRATQAPTPTTMSATLSACLTLREI